MSMLATLDQAGLRSELDQQIASFMVKDDDGARQQLLAVVDSHGLESPEVMRVVGSFQRSEILKPGLYQSLVDLQKKIGGNGNGNNVIGEQLIDVTEMTALSDAQEKKIRERMAKEKERFQKRLLDREAKLRERLMSVSSKRAQRTGIRVQEIQEVIDLRAVIKEKRAGITALRAEMRDAKAKLEILKPRRLRGPRKAKVAVEDLVQA
jgi:hypothetical protein